MAAGLLWGTARKARGQGGESGRFGFAEAAAGRAGRFGEEPVACLGLFALRLNGGSFAYCMPCAPLRLLMPPDGA